MGTTTRPLTPKLSESARHIVIPDGIKTTGWPALAAKGAELGIGFDPWQHGLGTLTLGKRADGKYAATIGGIVISIPRQVGKTYFVYCLLVLLCILNPGLKVLWTAHRDRTASSTFRNVRRLMRGRRLRRYLQPDRSDGIRSANGQQEVNFANGSVMQFGTRGPGFAIGFDAIDVIVFDEAQNLTEDFVEGITPTANQSRHPAGALLFYMGTPPRPSDDGEYFASKRRQALKGTTNDTVYVEISADQGADPDDREQWLKANPSYPTRTPVEAMLRMRENLPSDEAWGREAYGLWPEEHETTAVISAEAWGWLESTGPDPTTVPTSFGVDESHDGQISIAACWRIDEGPFTRMHAEEVWAGGDRTQALDWLLARTEKHRDIPILIDGQSPAAALIPSLKAKHRDPTQGTAGDMAKACAGLLADVRALPPKFSHAPQPVLAAAVAGAKQRNIGTAGGWGWDRTDPSVVIAPLVAATLARHAASVVEPKKTRAPRRLY